MQELFNNSTTVCSSDEIPTREVNQQKNRYWGYLFHSGSFYILSSGQNFISVGRVGSCVSSPVSNARQF